MTRVRSRLALFIACAMSASVAPAQDTPQLKTSQSTATCIAMPLPSVEGTAGSATEVAAAVRALFTSFLQGPSVGVVALDARLAQQATEEAKHKSCGQVLVVTLACKRGGGHGLGRVLGQAAGTAAWFTPVGTVAGAIGRGAAIAGAQAASEIAATTRAKDEMRLEYRLVSTDGSVIAGPKQQKAKASTDGEDLLTPLVQAASESIVSVVIKKQ